MAEISIIIPIYNTGKYIRECLQSVIDSVGFDMCEVILIDDGSTDDSVEIVKKTAGVYPNIALYQFANAGPSSARNHGMELAAGKYIYFLDSDDYLERDYLDKLYHAIEENQCDMVFAGFSKASEDRFAIQPVSRPILNETQIMSGIGYLNRRMDLGDWENRVWSMMFRRDFLLENHLCFDTEVFLYEDVLLINQALLYAKRICSVPTYGYQYRFRKESLVQGGVKEKDIEECIKVLQCFRTLCLELNQQQQKALGRVLFEHISMTLYYIGILKPDRKKEYYRQLQQTEILRILRKSITGKREWMKYLVFRYAIGMYYMLVKK